MFARIFATAFARFVALLGAAASLPLLCITAEPALAADESPASPNIVIVYADDLGYGDMQAYNPDRGKIPTPNFDRLATEGMRFTDAHSSSGVCTPSRYTLLTGRYHWRTRLQSGIVGVWGSPLIAEDRLTVGSLAKTKGYRTACIGKWHLGWDWPIPQGRRAEFVQTGRDGEAPSESQIALWKEVFSQPIPGGPTSRGFDSYFGTDVPNWPPYCFIENDRTVGIPDAFLNPKLLGNNQASKQGPALEGWTLEPILPALVERAEAFLAEAARDEAPFLLYLPLTAPHTPHTPLAVNDEFRGKSGLGPYADFVIETDAVVGRILDALDTHGLTDDTLVLFTSDNGCTPYIGAEELEKKGHFPSGPLRGYKSDAWEGGHRVPFVVRWPGVVEPGSVYDGLAHQADVFATVAEALDVPISDDAGEDSFSLLPVLQGSAEPVREHAVSCSIRGVPTLRFGKWKYVAAPGSGGWTKGESDSPVQLYDLDADLGETNNLASSEPDRVAAMQELLEKVITRGRSAPGPDRPNDVRVKRYP